jgi:hypothetical protein
MPCLNRAARAVRNENSILGAGTHGAIPWRSAICSFLLFPVSLAVPFPGARLLPWVGSQTCALDAEEALSIFRKVRVRRTLYPINLFS